jgi:hypothetical protein
MNKLQYEDLIISHGVKCYWGAFDSKTQRVIDNQEKALKLIRTVHPNAKTCYFPVDGYYNLHTGYPDYKDICETSYDRGDVLWKGLEVLKLIEN